MKLYRVKYTNKIDEKFYGLATNFPLIPFTWIKIRPFRATDLGLFKHEIEHAKQHLMTLTLHPILYLISKKYRLWAEVQAYKKQLGYSSDKDRETRTFARFISEKYGLDIEYSEALKKLKEE